MTKRTWILGPMLLALVSLSLAGRPQARAESSDIKSNNFKSMKVREVRLHRGSFAVILQTPDKKMILPIWIGKREAQAIHLRLSKTKLPRPMTHDLLESVLAIMGAKVVRIEIMDLRDSVFIGKLDLTDAKGNKYRLDGRPSDLIALAVGAGLPVRVNRKVLDKAGVDISGPVEDLVDPRSKTGARAKPPRERAPKERGKGTAL